MFNSHIYSFLFQIMSMNLCSTSLANMMSTFENIICRSLLKHFLIHIVENQWSIIIITPINCYWQTAPSLLEHHQFALANIVVLSFLEPLSVLFYITMIMSSLCPSVPPWWQGRPTERASSFCCTTLLTACLHAIRTLFDPKENCVVWR